MTAAKRKSDFKLTSELWGVCGEDFGENWPRYNGTALYEDTNVIGWKKKSETHD